MPCNGGYTDAQLAKMKVRQLQPKLDELTDLLCKTITHMPPGILAGMPKSVKDWWEEHKKADKAARRGPNGKPLKIVFVVGTVNSSGNDLQQANDADDALTRIHDYLEEGFSPEEIVYIVGTVHGVKANTRVVIESLEIDN